MSYWPDDDDGKLGTAADKIIALIPHLDNGERSAVDFWRNNLEGLMTLCAAVNLARHHSIVLPGNLSGYADVVADYL